MSHGFRQTLLAKCISLDIRARHILTQRPKVEDIHLSVNGNEAFRKCIKYMVSLLKDKQYDTKENSKRKS